jgi:LysR family transcriptional regulator, benzoate and cis,cis-muconate-responsive activator of ben and cat genes
MELKQLRHFAAVAQYGSFSRAAQHFNLTQPALSRQVKNLENELGVALLTRTDSGVTLTAAGIIFLDEAREILATTDSAVRRIQRNAREKALRVGYLSAFVAGVMPVALARFKATVAATGPELFDLTPQEIVYKANGGELDVAVLPEELEAQVPDFQWTTFRHLSAVLVMPKQHPLAKLKSISPPILGDYPVHGLNPSTFPEYAPRLRAMLRPFDIKPVFEDQTADGAQTLFHALEADMGLAVLVEGVATMLPSQLTVRSFRPPLPPLRVGIGQPHPPRNKQAEIFVKILHEVAGSVRRRQSR